MTRGLRQTNIARHDGIKDLATKMLQQLGRHFGRQSASSIVHGSQQPLDVEIGVDHIPHVLHGPHQVREPLQGIVFTLHGDQNAIRRHQRIERQNIEGRRTVNHHKMIIFPTDRQSL